jgi:hypothetical protein
MISSLTRLIFPEPHLYKVQQFQPSLTFAGNAQATGKVFLDLPTNGYEIHIVYYIVFINILFQFSRYLVP